MPLAPRPASAEMPQVAASLSAAVRGPPWQPRYLGQVWVPEGNHPKEAAPPFLHSPHRLPSLDEAHRPGGVQGAHWPVLQPQLWLPAPCSLPVATTPVLEVMKMHLSAGRRPLLSVISFSLSGTPAGAAGRKGGIIGSRFVELMGKQTQEEGALSLCLSLSLSHGHIHTHTHTHTHTHAQSQLLHQARPPVASLVLSP